MMELAMAAAEENGLTKPNPIKILREIWGGLNRELSIVGILGDKSDFLEAFILLRIEPLWYSDEISLVERVIIVRKEYRGAKAGRARLLCEFAKKVSDELQMPLIIGVLSSHRTEGKVKLYERQFGQSSGAFWIYNGKTGQSNTEEVASDLSMSA
jgi:hypothetical protein